MSQVEGNMRDVGLKPREPCAMTAVPHAWSASVRYGPGIPLEKTANTDHIACRPRRHQANAGSSRHKATFDVHTFVPNLRTCLTLWSLEEPVTVN
jgi:hypothetical protein